MKNGCSEKLLAFLSILSLLLGICCSPIIAFASEEITPMSTVDPYEIEKIALNRLLSNTVKDADGNPTAVVISGHGFDEVRVELTVR